MALKQRELDSSTNYCEIKSCMTSLVFSFQLFSSMRHNQHSATIDMTFLALVHTVLFTSQLRLLITRRKEDSLFTCWLVKLPNDQCNKQFITVHKRSLRRLCFHRCLSPMGGSGPLHAGTPPPPGQTPPWTDTPWPDIPLTRPPGKTPPPVDGQTSPLGRHPPGRQPPLCSACWDTVNTRAIRIPLECILVWFLSPHHHNSIIPDFPEFILKLLAHINRLIR